MAIVRLLQEAAFPPDRVQAIAQAYDAVCKELLLARRDDPLTVRVAQKVIAIACTGERDAEAIAHKALEELLGEKRTRVGGDAGQLSL
ncbi:MAG TPA: hypothetical protein VFL51_17440 [Pseudolabrys sp.]|nr:hypothetical protein [Pseudolabrys sp.]